MNVISTTFQFLDLFNCYVICQKSNQKFSLHVQRYLSFCQGEGWIEGAFTMIFLWKIGLWIRYIPRRSCTFFEWNIYKANTWSIEVFGCVCFCVWGICRFWHLNRVWIRIDRWLRHRRRESSCHRTQSRTFWSSCEYFSILFCLLPWFVSFVDYWHLSFCNQPLLSFSLWDVVLYIASCISSSICFFRHCYLIKSNDNTYTSVHTNDVQYNLFKYVYARNK